jgi:NhaP-type Na+/H+ or K+/H+ antiporter
MAIDPYIFYLLAIGLLLLGSTLGSKWIARLPLSYALIYWAVGVFLGPYGIELIQIKPGAEFLERLTELVVIVSLFNCGLKMNRPLTMGAWNSTIRLIGLLMPLSILAIAVAGHGLLGMDWGIAILLGAILAPTDPVLASEVQLMHTNDKNELRFGLTSEGGLNDALAFPFIYFGLHWLNDNHWKTWLISWVGIDLVWAVAAGVGAGIAVGKAANWLAKRFHKTYGVEEDMEDLVAIAVILLTYSMTEIINGYGFLAVFVAGITVRRSHHLQHEKKLSQLEFTGQIERLLEIGTILLLGAMLRLEPLLKYGGQALLITGLLLFLIRPLGAWISMTGAQLRPITRLLFGWFGIRGVGSLYYLSYVLSEGIPDAIGAQLGWIVYGVVTVSVILHGISATPLMTWYEKFSKRRHA